MRILKSYLLLAVVVALSSTVAVADRIGTSLPVKIGTGSAVTTNVIFDIGSGSTNPEIQSTSAGVLKLSNDETNFVTVPSANDTMCVLAASQTLTNKTISGSSNTLTVLAGSQLSGQVPTANGGTNASSWTAGSVPYLSSSTQFGQDNANFFWDGTSHRLGIGTAAPDNALEIVGGGAHIQISGGSGQIQLERTTSNAGSVYIGTASGDFRVGTASGGTNIIQGTSSGIIIGSNTTGDLNLGTIDSVTTGNHYDGHFTASFGGAFSVSQNATVQYRFYGKMVMLYVPAVTATCNTATVITASAAIPSAIIPAATVAAACFVQDASTAQNTPGVCRVFATNGNIEVDKTWSGSGAFTNAGTCGLQAPLSIVYYL